jgi:hypothetical protein
MNAKAVPALVRPRCGSGIVVVALALALALALAACSDNAGLVGTLNHLRASGFDERATSVCTKTGSTPVPLMGSTHVVAAVDSTVGAVSKLVAAPTRHSFETDFGTLGEGSYIAICFVTSEVGGSDQRSVLVQRPDASGSVIIGAW